MKRFLSIALALISLFLIPSQVIAADTAIDGELETLPHLEAAMGEIRTRKQVDGLRL